MIIRLTVAFLWHVWGGFRHTFSDQLLVMVCTDATGVEWRPEGATPVADEAVPPFKPPLPVFKTKLGKFPKSNLIVVVDSIGIYIRATDQSPSVLLTLGRHTLHATLGNEATTPRTEVRPTK